MICFFFKFHTKTKKRKFFLSRTKFSIDFHRFDLHNDCVHHISIVSICNCRFYIGKSREVVDTFEQLNEQIIFDNFSFISWYWRKSKFLLGNERAKAIWKPVDSITALLVKVIDNCSVLVLNENEIDRRITGKLSWFNGILTVRSNGHRQFIFHWQNISIVEF